MISCPISDIHIGGLHDEDIDMEGDKQEIEWIARQGHFFVAIAALKCNVQTEMASFDVLFILLLEALHVGLYNYRRNCLEMTICVMIVIH